MTQIFCHLGISRTLSARDPAGLSPATFCLMNEDVLLMAWGGAVFGRNVRLTPNVSKTGRELLTYF